MKRRIQFILFFSLAIATINIAQVTEESKPMKLGANNALVIEVTDAGDKIAEKVWKDLMKKYRGKTKKKRKESEWTTERVRLSAITGQESATIYSKIEEEDGTVTFTLWVPGEEEYLSSSSDPTAYAAAEKLLEDYALEVRIAIVDEEFKSKERILESYQKDLKKLVSKNEDYHKTIKKSDNSIDSSEKGLEQNAEDQKLIQEQFEAAEAVFTVANDTLRAMLREADSKDEEKNIKKMIKTEEGKVKSVEKMLKKLRKEEKKMNKTIENAKDAIYQAEEDIEKNVKDQERKQEQIEEQKGVVEEVKGRLDQLKGYRS